MTLPPSPNGHPSRPLLRPGDTCWRVAPAGRVCVLVDADPYFRALRDAFERAQRSILILGWDFEADLVLDPRGDGPGSQPLREYLPELLDRRPELEIRILIWGFSLVYGQTLSLPPALDPSWPNHPRLHFRFANDHPLGASHHEKLVCVDDAVAFAGGIDLTAARWDTRAHEPDDPERVDGHGKAYGPKHDVQLAVDGAAAASLAELARTRWHDVTEELVPAVEAADTWPADLAVRLRDVDVGIARTRPAHGDQPEIREAEALTLQALASARERVYVETQYFTAVVVGDALAELLERRDGPEIVAVVNKRNDGMIERYAMGENRDRLLRRLAAAPGGGRLRVYYPTVTDARGREHDIDVHSKLIAVDDRFLRVGSSNMNNRSMGFDSECDLAVEAHDERSRSVLRSITSELLAEHLGRTPEEVAAAVERHGFVAGLERLDSGPRRRLVRLEVDADGPRDPVAGTPLVDPGGPRDHLPG